MVCNIFKILDENELKQLSIIEYNMGKPDYIWKFEEILTNYNFEKLRRTGYKERMITKNSAGGQCFDRGYNQASYDKACNDCKEHYDEFLEHWLMELELSKFGIHRIYWNDKRICDYLGVIPFTPSVMINISPDWGSVEQRSNFCKIKILHKLISKYMKEQWFSSWEYVIENGSNGDHIHAHIVAKMNTQRLKSVESHLKKGNHTQQLKKYAKGFKGMEGMIKGNSVQKIFLRTEEIVKDKLLYLHEDTKPEGHKNKSVIKDGFVVGCL